MNILDKIKIKFKSLSNRSRKKPKENRRHLLVPIFSAVVIAFILVLPKKSYTLDELESGGPDLLSAVFDDTFTEFVDLDSLSLYSEDNIVGEVRVPVLETVTESIGDVVTEGWSFMKIIMDNIEKLASSAILFYNLYFLVNRRRKEKAAELLEMPE